MKDFIKFKRTKIFNAYMREGTTTIYINYGNSANNEIDFDITSPEQFSIVTDYFGLKKNISFTSCPTQVQLLPNTKDPEPIVAFALITDEFLDFVAIGDENGENFYHLADGKIYTKQALFDMYRLKQTEEISEKIQKLSNELVEISKLTISDVTKS